MTFRTSVTVSSLTDAADEAIGEIAADATTAMRGATDTLKTTLRRQVTDAGLGTRLANTWRADTYPESRNALNPSGYAWSNAPNIIDAFARGATIRPTGGRDYVWIPTKAVPQATGGGRATSTKKMTPPEVLESFGQADFVIKKGKGGHLLAFIVEGRALTARGGLRKLRRGRLGHGAAGQLVLMFTLTPSVTLPQELDLDAAAKEGAADFVDRFRSSRSQS